MAKCNHKCEVYSRVAGYLRPTCNWNQGKREEFLNRKTYNISNQSSRCVGWTGSRDIIKSCV